MIEHHVTLCLDASSPVVHVGILSDGRWQALKKSRAESINAIFAGTAKCLRETGRELKGIDGFVFCEGPGSILGIRLAAMAINTWRNLPEIGPIPIAAFGSLQAVAAILERGGVSRPFNVISDYRKNLWNLLSISASSPPAPIVSAGPDEIAALSGQVYHIPTRAFGSAPPKCARQLDYDLTELPVIARNPGFLRPVEFADSIQTNLPVYRKWQARRHR
jgi:tRNA threonylcarbamoyladenosine biosynthesis protein TsaB